MPKVMPKPFNCVYCNKAQQKGNIARHENACYLNPKNLRECLNCKKPVKHLKGKGTCSRSCSNSYFRTGNRNGSYKKEPTAYRTICFRIHEKKCVVCDEEKIVAVHHYDHNRKNNDPANLVPMCPTHHQYVHSRYAAEVMDAVHEYVKKFISGCS